MGSVPDLTPKPLKFIEQLVCEPESITSENDFTAIVKQDAGYTSPMIERLLRNVVNLRSLTWYSDLPFPRDALRTLQQILPSVDIKVISPWRSDLRLWPMDCLLLSSPQIRSVHALVQSPPANRFEAYSEYGILKDCLMKGNSIKRLTIDADLPRNFSKQTDDSALLNWTRVTQSPLNFDWKDGDRFPALEELELTDKSYYLPVDHCELWTH